MRVGTPRCAAAHKVGPLAYPPTPTATSGRKSRTIRRAIRRLLHSRHNTLKLANGLLRLKPLTGRPLIGYPAAGTFSISMRLSAPTNNISASGHFTFIALAIEIAGKICPPVPPPLIKTLIVRFIFFLC